MELTLLAHSGAIIGAQQPIDVNDPDMGIHGEIPRSQPTIRELVNMFPGDPQDVDLVLIDGCINDITSRWVALPEYIPRDMVSGPIAISTKDLNMRLQFRQEISEICHDHLKGLLQEVARKFNNPETRIVVTGYYQAISDRTDFRNGGRLFHWLTSGIGPFDALLPQEQMVFNWQLFQMDSNRNIKRAVNEVNLELWNAGNQPSYFVADNISSLMPLQPPGGDRPTGTPNPFEFVNPCFLEQPRPAPARIAFACPRFTADNAMYAPNSFVFQLDGNLNPTDPIRDERANACSEAIEALLIEPLSPEYLKCRIVSTGHPNPNGDIAYADAIMSTLPNDFFRKHYPERKQITATFLDAKLVRSDGSVADTRAAFLFNLGANRFYPESDFSEGANINYGAIINFPANFSISGVEVLSNPTMGLEVRVVDAGLHPPRVPGRPPADTPDAPGIFGENPLILTLTRYYTKDDNFGQGIHTERSEDFVAGPSILRPITAHFEITYRIDVADYNPFAG